jgi:hypothetical protein
MKQHKWLKESHAWLDDPESVQCQVRDEWHAPQGINNPIVYPEQNWRIKPKNLSINGREFPAPVDAAGSLSWVRISTGTGERVFRHETPEARDLHYKILVEESSK